MQLRLTPITPKRLNTGAMRATLLQGLRTVGEEIREDFNSTVETWHDKPTFEPFSAQPVVTGDIAVVETTTTDKVYGWVSKGTKAHIIKPINGPLLVFPGTFTPKTMPGVILAGPGFSGPPIERRGMEGVRHPGVEPREFPESIKDRQEKHAISIIKIAMSSARRVSGHAFP